MAYTFLMVRISHFFVGLNFYHRIAAVFIKKLIYLRPLGKCNPLHVADFPNTLLLKKYSILRTPNILLYFLLQGQYVS